MAETKKPKASTKKIKPVGKTVKAAESAMPTGPPSGRTGRQADQTVEEVLKAKKTATKTVKKAGPKHTRAKTETETAPKLKTDTAEAKKPVAQPTRSPLERRGKNYRKVYGAFDHTKHYGLDEAISLLPKTSFVKFDPSVEVHINLGVDVTQADQAVRATVVLPHGSGKSQRVAALVDTDKQAEAKAAGADLVGHEDLLEDIGKGKFDFDILVTTPDMMAQLGKHAKELGPKGLMPNPKSGTVTKELAKAVKELKAGRIEFRADASGIVHQVVGKLSLKPGDLTANIKALLKAVQQARPDSIKGTYIQKIAITTSMGPSLKLDTQEVLKNL